MSEPNFYLELDEYAIYIYCCHKSVDIIIQLEEAKYKGKPLISKYSAKEHSPHVKPNQHHLHVYAKNKYIFAINKDGTAHDGSHGIHIPNKVADALRVKFPDYTIPDDNFLESASSHGYVP